MIKFIRSLLCKHRDVHFVRNVYGDEINTTGGKRSVWRCQRCGGIVLRDLLHTTPTEDQSAPDPARYSAGPLPETGWD